jgi:hypothetical protein
MFVLMSVFVMGFDFQGTSLDSLEGKWTVALRMSSLVIPSQYSVLWRPFKTVMIGIEGSGSPVNRGKRRRYPGDDYESWDGSVDIGFHKYFRANSSFSPFGYLSPGFSASGSNYSYYDDDWRENSYQYYRLVLGVGGECFFKLAQKQLGLKLRGSLVTLSRRYSQHKYSDSENRSYVEDRARFYLPTGGSLQTWLCLHF